jgi:glycosyltransferase involved in cell wall biosynthesis
MSQLAVVVIGRNEGERLKRCLLSVVGTPGIVVYVDSGSTDESIAYAKALGAEVVCLDMRRPFTAARARNEGWRHALSRQPETAHVQFVDGDCEVREGWLALAQAHLLSHPEIAGVCGRRRERFPQASVYNGLCDLEWDTPIGLAKAFGGDAMVRLTALQEVGGYREDVIAGEEPELCVRLRATGWRVWRLDAEMTWHDAAICQFRQWWLRTKRCGFAYARGSELHGAPPELHWVKETRRAILWGAGAPALILSSTLIFGPIAWTLWLIYPCQVARLAWASPPETPLRWHSAVFLVLGKFAEAQGVWQWWWQRVWHQGPKLIEYK